MNAGQLDRRVTLENYTTTRDAWNNPTKTWATLDQVWAHKRDVTELERRRLNNAWPTPGPSSRFVTGPMWMRR